MAINVPPGDENPVDEADEQAPFALPLPPPSQLVHPAAMPGTIEVVAGDTAELLRERERLRDPAVRQAASEAAERERVAGLRAARAPVSFAQLRGLPERTLREAGLELERHEGELRIEDGRLTVIAPPFAPPTSPTNWVGQALRESIEVLVAGAPEIVKAAGKRSGTVAAEKLPDKLVGAAGGLL